MITTRGGIESLANERHTLLMLFWSVVSVFVDNHTIDTDCIFLSFFLTGLTQYLL